MDDLSLVLKTSHGLVLITGCCHAGLLNTLHHVESTFGGPVLAVMGGTHLISASDDYLTHILEVFRVRLPGDAFLPQPLHWRESHPAACGGFRGAGVGFPGGDHGDICRLAACCLPESGQNGCIFGLIKG